MLRKLLEGGAELASRIVAEYEAPFAGVKEFLAYQDSLMASGDRIVYSDGKAEIIL